MMPAARIAIPLRRRAMKPTMQHASTLAPSAGQFEAVVCATAMVMVVLVVAAVGVIVAGVNEHDALAGSPEQVKVTVPLNPPSAVSVIESVPLDPGETGSVAVPADT